MSPAKEREGQMILGYKFQVNLCIQIQYYTRLQDWNHVLLLWSTFTSTEKKKKEQMLWERTNKNILN